MDILLIVLCILNVITLGLMLWLLFRQKQDNAAAQMEELRADMREEQSRLRMELTDATQRSVKLMGDMLGEKQEQTRRGLTDMGTQMDARLNHFAMENAQQLENIRAVMEKRLRYLQEDNNAKLEAMRVTVDEKLQRTLDERMTRSFALVNERLEQVYKGLGEMQTLAVGVGDLKRVLSGVKTRGILGELQLGAILEELLSPEQYARDVLVDKDGKKPVEFAIKLPGDGNSPVYLPIDSKFPADAYAELMDAYESGDADALRTAQGLLRARVRAFAKDIHDKYIEPPFTTDFAVMFLPTEGLYAEVVRLGLLERMQQEFRVSIAGPSTMGALLNSLQMGFRSIAIQRRSGEVWKLLSAVKTEFAKFAETLEKAQEKLNRASGDLDALIGVRTRQIRKSLRNVTELPAEEVPMYLPELGDGEERE